MFWPKLQKIVFWGFLILIVVSTTIYYSFGNDTDIQLFQQYIKDFGFLAPLIFLVLYTLLSIFIPITPFLVIAGLLFGFLYGLIYTIIGGFISAMLVFTFSRKIGRERVKEILENKYLKNLDKYNKKLEKDGIWDLVILRIIPIMPFNVLNIFMGVSNIKTKNYMIGTIFGILPSHVVTIFLASLASKIL